jgi:hypothetical protein
MQSGHELIITTIHQGLIRIKYTPNLEFSFKWLLYKNAV